MLEVQENAGKFEVAFAENDKRSYDTAAAAADAVAQHKDYAALLESITVIAQFAGTVAKGERLADSVKFVRALTAAIFTYVYAGMEKGTSVESAVNALASVDKTWLEGAMVNALRVTTAVSDVMSRPTTYIAGARLPVQLAVTELFAGIRDQSKATSRTIGTGELANIASGIRAKLAGK